MDALTLSLMLASIGLVLALLTKIADKRILVTSAVLFAVYLALDDFTTGLPNLVKALDVIPIRDRHLRAQAIARRGRAA